MVLKVVFLHRRPDSRQSQPLRLEDEDSPDDAPPLRLHVHLPKLIDVVDELNVPARLAPERL